MRGDVRRDERGMCDKISCPTRSYLSLSATQRATLCAVSDRDGYMGMRTRTCTSMRRHVCGVHMGMRAHAL